MFYKYVPFDSYMYENILIHIFIMADKHIHVLLGAYEIEHPMWEKKY